jgi:hypothetical protein
MDDFEDLRANPLGWIMSNIEDDLSGIEWVIDDMDADAILDPALEAYIIPQFQKAGVTVPERAVLIASINQLIKRITWP